MKRFFVTACVLLSGAGCAVAQAARQPGEQAARRPNVIFILSDDHRWDAMGVVQREQGEKGRFPWLKTPSMDRLSAEGVRFTNAFDVLSLCSPSRAALLTGQYNHTNGITTNGMPLSESAVTHASLLREAGYTTGYFGKWHMGRQSGKRPGFDRSVSFVGQGHYIDCELEVDGKATPTKGWVDDVSTDFAISWMKEVKADPFLLVLGFKSPHSPRGGDNLPDRLRHLYKDEKSRRVPNLGVAPVWQTSAPPGAGMPRGGLVDAEVHRDYMRHVTGVDQNIGRLLDAIDELGLRDDTVVIYSSDNGYYLGEHCSGDKRSAYEESLRIPLLVRYPKLYPAATTVDKMVLNIDLAPTLLDFAGVPKPGSMQGMSWKSVAAGKGDESWRESFLFQYYKELGGVPTLYGMRTESHKLVLYPGKPEWTEVYDLAQDPYEIRNLAGDPELREGLEGELQHLIREAAYPVPTQYNQRYRADAGTR